MLQVETLLSTTWSHHVRPVNSGKGSIRLRISNWSSVRQRQTYGSETDHGSRQLIVWRIVRHSLDRRDTPSVQLGH